MRIAELGEPEVAAVGGAGVDAAVGVADQWAEADLAGANQDQLIDSAGALIGILTGRRSTRSITGSSRSRASRRSKEERLRSAQAKATDMWQDMANGKIILASVQSGGSCIHVLLAV